MIESSVAWLTSVCLIGEAASQVVRALAARRVALKTIGISGYVGHR